MRRIKEYLPILTIAIFIGLMLILPIYFRYSNSKVLTINIKKTSSISTKNGHKYLIFTKQGVFKNTDMIFIWKFNSSDFQNELIGKKECKVEVRGYRVPLFSMYPNITKIYWCK